MSHKYSDLIRRAITRLSMVSESNVQLFSENIIAEFMQHAFTNAFDRMWWPQYTFWHSDTLTADGVVQSDLSDPAGTDIDRYYDIQYIFYDQDRLPLPRVWGRSNVPYLLTRGTRPGYHEPWGEPGKFFRVIPFGDLQPVHIRYRRRPDPFGPNSIVDFDDELLILGAAWEYMEDDASNPGSAEKLRAMYNDRWKIITGQDADQEVPLQDVQREQLDNWREVY